MKRILITTPEIRAEEPRRIRMTLENGWDGVHLRHPDATITDMRKLIEAIPQRFHGRLHLHGHFALVDEFNLGGLQLNSRCPDAPENYSGLLSRTCHSVDEVIEADKTGRYSYLTLSPIFASISKPGYKPTLELIADIARLTAGTVATPLIALGGITPERASALSRDIFSGIAVIGYLAEAVDDKDFIKRLNTI